MYLDVSKFERRSQNGYHNVRAWRRTHLHRRQLQLHRSIKGMLMFAALGSFVYRYRWAVIAVWVVIFAISLVYFPRVSSVLKGGGFDLPDAESGKARAIIENELGASPLSYLYVIHSDTLTADDPAFKGHVAELIRRLKDEPGVKDVSLGNTSADRHTLYFTADLDLTFDDSIAEVPRFRALVPDAEVHTYLTGYLGVYHD